MIETRVFPLRSGAASQVRTSLAGIARLGSLRRAEAALLVAELFANAIVHSDAEEAEVSIEPRANAVRVSVVHEATGPLEEPEFGLGFRILDSFSRAWG